MKKKPDLSIINGTVWIYQHLFRTSNSNLLTTVYSTNYFQHVPPNL